MENSLLFVYQNEEQSRLLARYGDELSLLDATYKTTRYTLPLFFLVVKTNVDYQVVATFISESETTEGIMEALEKIKEWNPNWNPRVFMTDYSNEEMNAIEAVFGNHCFFQLIRLSKTPKLVNPKKSRANYLSIEFHPGFRHME